MATFSSFLDRMHSVFRDSKNSGICCLCTEYLTCQFYFAQFSKIRLIHSFLRCVCGSVSAFSDDRNVNILKPKRRASGPKASSFFSAAVSAGAMKDITFPDKLCLTLEALISVER